MVAPEGEKQGFHYFIFFKIREAWTWFVADGKEPLKKVRSQRAQLGKGGVPGQEGMGSRTQGKGLTPGRRTERGQLHCIKVSGGGDKSRHQPFVSLVAES